MKKDILLTLVVVFGFNMLLAQSQLIAPKDYQNKQDNISFERLTDKSFISPSDYIFYEGFDDCTLPDGWFKTDFECTWQFSNNASDPAWTIPYRGNCYASARDAICVTDMIDIRLATPNIDLSAVDNAVLQFVTYNFSDICEVEVTLDQGTTYTTLLTLENTTLDDGWQIIEVSLDDFVGNDEVRISFTYSQNQDWGYGWAIDDIAVFERPINDVYAAYVTPVIIQAGQNLVPDMAIVNAGSTSEITNLTMELIVKDGFWTEYEGGIWTPSITVDPGDTFEIGLEEWVAPELGSYTATAIVTADNDENPYNDTIRFDIDVVEAFEAYYHDGFHDDLYSFVLPFGDSVNVADYTGSFPYSMEYANGVYYLVANDNKLYTIDVATGILTEVATITGLASFIPTGLAYDWVNDVMYISAVDGGSSETHICTIDLATAVMTEIGVATGADMMISIDFDNLHNLYCISINTDNLYKISTVDASVTSIGYVGQDLAYAQDISYNMATGIMYGCLYGETNGLFKINLEYATTELVVPYANQIGAFAIPYDNILEPKFISFNFDDQIGNSDIDYDAYSVDIVMPNGFAIDNMIADFVLQYSVTATVSAVEQESGVTSNDFSGSVTYLLSVDGGDTQEWTVNVSEEPLVAGSDCDLAIYYGIVGSPSQTDILQAGEEHWYSFTIEEEFQDVVISLCGSNFNTKLDLFTLCDSHYPYRYDDNSCEAYESRIEFNTLTVGDYLVRVSGFAGAYGIYELTIEAAINAEIENTSQIELYPNPTSGYVNIVSKEQLNVQIIDITGKLVDSFIVEENGEFYFDGKAGIYTLILDTENDRFIRKIVVQ